jgi:hypothetical protein
MMAGPILIDPTIGDPPAGESSNPNTSFWVLPQYVDDFMSISYHILSIGGSVVWQPPPGKDKDKDKANLTTDSTIVEKNITKKIRDGNKVWIVVDSPLTQEQRNSGQWYGCQESRAVQTIE